MKCCKCGKKLTPEDALHCENCLRDYCPDCAKTALMCDCFGGLNRYN